MKDSFKARTTLACGSNNFEIFSLAALKDRNVARLPYSLKILLENLLRFEDGVNVTRADIDALLNWDPKAAPSYEISFTPSRVIMQDFTGVPAVVDLAAMREAMIKLGGNPDEINPLSPAELVIDHSVQVDAYGTADSLAKNTAIEFGRNTERYAFLRWGQTAFRNFKVVPPNTGIVHQVNIEHLARVVFDTEKDGVRWAYPDTLVGTDSHTTMVNGLGVLGWGVGGIEAEAAMLGQPVTMLIPHVIGFKLIGHSARRHDRDRPGAHCHRDAAQEGRGRQVRRVLRRWPCEPAARRSRHDRQHGAGVRQHLRHLPDRQRNAALPRAHRPQRRADRAGEGLCEAPGHVARERRSRRPTTPMCSNSISAPSSLRSPARSVRRIACRCAPRSRPIRRLTRRWPRSAQQKNPSATGVRPRPSMASHSK